VFVFARNTFWPDDNPLIVTEATLPSISYTGAADVYDQAAEEPAVVVPFVPVVVPQLLDPELPVPDEDDDPLSES
jgi:hypothetical protein